MSGILITGGSGYLGERLAARLLRDGWERICIYSRGEHRQAAMREALGNSGQLRWFIGDVRDEARLVRAMSGVEVVIHGAALKRIEVGNYAPDEMVKTNVLGSMNVVEAASRAGVKKCLLVSSDKAYQPVSPYGQAKALAESIFLTAGVLHPDGPAYGVVRYGNVWGSTGSVVPTWKAALAGGRTICVTDPACTRFFMPVEEAVDLVLGTVGTMTGGEIAIPELPAYRLADLLTAMGVERPTVTGLPVWEKLHESMSDALCSRDARRMMVNELKEALNGLA